MPLNEVHDCLIHGHWGGDSIKREKGQQVCREETGGAIDALGTVAQQGA